MNNKIFENLHELTSGAIKELKVKSALNPILWMIGITSLPFIVACFLSTILFLKIFFAIMSAVPVFVGCVIFVYFALKQPEKLQSEEFQVRNQALSFIKEKTPTVVFHPDSIERVLGEMMRYDMPRLAPPKNEVTEEITEGEIAEDDSTASPPPAT
jgi:hypothetical protein